jgi:hypothetical protein
LLLDFANAKKLDPRVTFTRATTATYYDADTTALGEQNLLLNSRGNSMSELALASNSSTNPAPDGTNTANLMIPNTSNTRHIVYSSTSGGTLLSGQITTMSVFAKAGGYNFVQLGYYIDSGGASASIVVNLTNGTISASSGTLISSSVTSVGSGWYRLAITYRQTFSSEVGIIVGVSNDGTLSSTNAGSPSFAGNGTSGVYYWGIQAEQRSSATVYTATTPQAITNYIPVLMTAGGDQPRFDHNPTTRESLGLLIEEQRTNIATYSAQFDNGSWGKDGGISVTANQAVAPDGTIAMDLMTRVPGSLSSWAQLTNTVSVGTGGNVGKTYSFSVWVQALPTAGTVSGILTISDVLYNSYTQPFTATTTPTRVSIISSGGSGWNAAGSFIGGGISLNSNNTSVLVWGAQLEVGAFPTSYIPTSGAAATRAADVVSLSGSNFASWYSPGNGTFYAEASTASTASDVMIAEGTNSSGAFMDFSLTFATTSTQFINRFVSTNNDLRRGGTVAANTMVRFSGSITNGSGTTVASTAGVTVGVSGNQPILYGADRMFIGSRGGSSLFLNAPIRKFAFYPAQLTQTQQNSITG